MTERYTLYELIELMYDNNNPERIIRESTGCLYIYDEAKEDYQALDSESYLFRDLDWKSILKEEFSVVQKELTKNEYRILMILKNTFHIKLVERTKKGLMFYVDGRWYPIPKVEKCSFNSLEIGEKYGVEDLLDEKTKKIHF